MLVLKKIIDNLFLDFKWLFRLPNSLEKFLYFPRKYYAIILNKRKIKYLWKEFYYDNRFTPALLQNYPYEIFNLDKFCRLSWCKTILDIWANIGQFSVTLSYFFSDLKIYSFEPNEEIFRILEKNINKNIIVNNFWISSENKTIDFHYISWKSAQWSIYENNSSMWILWWDKIIKTSIEVLNLTKNKCEELKIPTSYDLIKIDVEWLEKEVLEWIMEIDWKYLYMEASSERDWSITEEEILNVLSKKRFIYNILYTTNSKNNSSTYDIIIERNNF